MADEKNQTGIIPLEWALKDLSEPLLKEVGLDIRNGYIALKKIATNAVSKNSKSGLANKRVAMEILRAGAYIETDIAVEYFGGVLANSKTDLGDDDSGIYYTNLIKKLSSKQLHLHYIIYNSLQKLFLSKPESFGSINVGLETSLSTHKLFLLPAELDYKMKLQSETNMHALIETGVLGDYFNIKLEECDGRQIHYIELTPNALGIQLYAVAFNKLDEWRKFNSENFGEFSEIELPKIYSFNKNDIPDLTTSYLYSKNFDIP